MKKVDAIIKKKNALIKKFESEKEKIAKTQKRALTLEQSNKLWDNKYKAKMRKLFSELQSAIYEDWNK